MQPYEVFCFVAGGVVIVFILGILLEEYWAHRRELLKIRMGDK